MRSRQSRLVWILLAAFAFLLVIAAVSVGIYFLLLQQRAVDA